MCIWNATMRCTPSNMRATRSSSAASTSCSVRDWNRAMHPASGTAAFLIALSCCASVVAQPAQYNTSDTFQPGKKYNCVPTADRKGWNCSEIGKADPVQSANPDQSASPPAAAPAPPSVAVATSPPAPTAPQAIPATSPSAPTTNVDRSSRLPNYLTNESDTS